MKKLLAQAQRCSVFSNSAVLKELTSVTLKNIMEIYFRTVVFPHTHFNCSSPCNLQIRHLQGTLCPDCFFVHCNTYLYPTDCRVQGKIMLLSFFFFLKQDRNSVLWLKTNMKSFTCADITFS